MTTEPQSQYHSNKIHYINHHFAEWDSQTKHMNRLEKSIYLDLRTLYFANATKDNGKINSDDKELLYYRLACHTAEEKQAVERILQDKFKKIGNAYRHKEWDKQISNIMYAMNKGNADNRNTGNGQGNAMSNADRQKKLKAERKKILADLQNIGIVVDKDVAMATLRDTHAQHFINGLNNENDNVDNTQGNDYGNASNAQKRANNQDNNQDNISLTQAGEIELKNEQILMTNIQQWQAPTLDEMRSLLMNNNVFGVFNQETYDHCLKKFRTHYENEEAKGYFLVTQSIREQKLIEWVKQERPSREYRVNEQESPKPIKQKPVDPNTMAWVGCSFVEPLPNLNKQQTEYLITIESRKHMETGLETYNRLKREINWQTFDYQKSIKAVA